MVVLLFGYELHYFYRYSNRSISSFRYSRRVLCYCSTFVSDRYGSLDKFKETAIEDPAGVLADIATILSGGAGLVSKVGEVSKVGAVTKAGSKLAEISQAVEPVTAISKATGKDCGCGKRKDALNRIFPYKTN